MGPTDFFINFPEFQGMTDPLLVAACLNRAAVAMGGPNVAVWGSFATPTPAIRSGGTTLPGGTTIPTTADLAQGNLAAHYLVSSPFGTEMRLQPGGDGRSSYLLEYERLLETVAGGFLVAGVG